MRLIDADELQELLNWTHDRPPFSRAKVKNLIDMARTVDAIPIAWINEWYDRYMYAEVGDLLNDWAERKEE